jgi:alkanesulfonate monooxygenase SsuD/methylene tetrahydromethanopterin reductase-like flavin-dependent oxidoreductase (luciferase family)
MQFGLFSLFDFFPDCQNEASYYRETLDFLIYGEELGFDSVWVGEEHFYSFGICPSPQVFLTALARETSRIRLGTAISAMPFENPLRKAEDFAMLDILSNGRLNFGTGRGAYPKHFAGFQVHPLESRERYEEALEIVERAWTQERFSYQGKFWQIPELSVSPKPLQKPHPPIYRGAASPEGFMAAGAKGHGILAVPWLTLDIQNGFASYRAALQVHRHSAVPSVFVYFLFIDEDYNRAMAEAREAIGRYVEIVTSAFPLAFVEQLPPTNPIRTLRDRLRSMLDHSEERAIVGTPRDCRRRIAEVREELGIEHMAFYFQAGARDMTRARQCAEVFAKEVMPEFC